MTTLLTILISVLVISIIVFLSAGGPGGREPATEGHGTHAGGMP
jgi:hypothetical protein